MNSPWNRHRTAALLLLAGLAACEEPSPLPPPDGGGGGSTPLAIDSTKPAANVLAAPFGQPVVAFTDSAVQPSTLTVTSFSIASDSVTPIDVPRQVSVQGGNRLQAVASLLPGTKYRATISTTLLSTNGGALPAPHTWTFTTRPISHFPLASGTSFFGKLSLARDSTGGLHAVYADSVNGDFFYSECASGCALAANWSAPLTLDLGNVGSSSAIATDLTGRVHVVYRSDRLQTLQYATCLTACTVLTSWSFATADNSSSLIGINPSIYVTPDGIVNATYYDGINSFIRFARCLALCGVDANWANGTPDTGPFVGRSSAIVMDGAVRHVVYQDSGGRNLKYATCVATDCLQAADWTISAVSVADGGQDPAIVLGPNHLLAVTYFGSTDVSMKYASCASACVTIANWTTFALTTPAGAVGRGSGLAVDANGRVQAVFDDKDLKRLRYATCSSICTTSSRWRYSTIEEGGALIKSPAVVPSSDGGLEILYLGLDGTEVRFAE
jgi:hypothetical protein